MLHVRRIVIVAGAVLAVVMAGGAAAPHDPTAHPAWQGLGPAGAVPGVRKLAIDGSAVLALCDKGVVRIDAKGRASTVPTSSAFSRTPARPAWLSAKIYDLPDTIHSPEAVIQRRNGDTYVADAENNRVLVFTADGQYKRRVPENFCRPHGLALLPDDRMVVLCDYTEEIDTPLITILDANDVPVADWVSDRRVLVPRSHRGRRGPVFYKYCFGYYQKVGDHPKRPPSSISPLSCCVTLGNRLVVGQAVTGTLRAIDLDAFGPSAKYPARRRHIKRQAITANKAGYTIQVGGTLDYRNTTRSTTHSHYMQTPLFMVDDSYTIRNTGKTPVVNPHFAVNGQGDFFSAKHIRDHIVKPGMSNLEKAFAVYNFVRSYLRGTNWPASSTGLQSQYYVFDWWGIKKQGVHLTSKWNNFGAPGACGCYSAYVAKFAHDLGLPGRNGGVVGHCPSFVKVDGKEVYLDAIMMASYRGSCCGIFCPRIDNQSLANYEDITHDQYLILRTTEYPCGLGVGGCFGNKKRHNMNPKFYDKPPVWITHNDTSKLALTLRPGEAITRRTSWLGRSCVEPNMLMDAVVNGDITYRPNFADGTYRHGVVAQRGVAVRDGVVRPTQKDAAIAFSMACPHPMLTGTVELTYNRATSADALEMDVNIGGTGWQRIWRASRVGRATEMIYVWPIDHMRDTKQREWVIAPFSYAVRFRMRPEKPGASIAIRDVGISSLFQTFYQCMPRLTVGTNQVTYEDETPGAHHVTVTHRWKQSAFGTEPPPPAEPLFPKVGQTVTGYEFTFKWKPAVDPSGAKIVDYEWEASPRPDFMWHIGPNFALYTLGKTELPVPEYSLLSDNVTYYWRVRSRNDRGVWGPWSKTWTFRCRGPRVPVDVKVRQDGRRWVLSWKPNPKGTRPVKYEVFADNEPGFFPVVKTWRTHEKDRRKPFDKPSNIILVTDKTEVVVVADGLKDGDRTFFRVAAIDAGGSRSGPSEYVEAKHPFILTAPVTTAKVGKPYRYQARTLSSKGAFCLGSPGISRPQHDKIRFALKQAPAWLKIHAETGLVSGTPTSPGTVDVTLVVTDGQGGSDTQQFRIAVSP